MENNPPSQLYRTYRAGAHAQYGGYSTLYLQLATTVCIWPVRKIFGHRTNLLETLNIIEHELWEFGQGFCYNFGKMTLLCHGPKSLFQTTFKHKKIRIYLASACAWEPIPCQSFSRNLWKAPYRGRYLWLRRRKGNKDFYQSAQPAVFCFF